MRCVSRLIVLAACASLCATASLAQDAESEIAQTGIDWSVGLRGSYAANTLTGGQAGLSLTPEASLTLDGQSSLAVLGAGAEIVIDSAGKGRLADIHASAISSLQLGELTTLDGSIDAALTQAAPSSNGLPANTLFAPLVLDANVQGSVTQDLDKIVLKGTLDGQRLAKGKTTLVDLTTVDNSHENYWQGGATLRVGYELTPLLAAFIEGVASVSKYDSPDPTLLVYSDGRTYQLRGGLSFEQNSTLSAEASIGRAWLDYFDPSLTDAPSWVYNGSLTIRPDETLSIIGQLETALGPSDTVAGDTDVDYVASVDTTYAVNPWLTLRGHAGWDQTVTLGTGDNSWGYEAGVGVDYQSSRYVVWSGDYLFARDYAPPTPLNDTHTVTVGVRVQR